MIEANCGVLTSAGCILLPGWRCSGGSGALCWPSLAESAAMSAGPTATAVHRLLRWKICLHVEGVGVAFSRGVPWHCRPCLLAEPKVGNPCCSRLCRCMLLPFSCVAAWIMDAIGWRQERGRDVSPTSFHSGRESNPAKIRDQAAGSERLGNERNELGSSTLGGVQQLLTCTPDTPPPPLGVRLAVVVCGKLFTVPYSVFVGAVRAVW